MPASRNMDVQPQPAANGGSEIPVTISGALVIGQDQVIAHSPELSRLFPKLLQIRPALTELPAPLVDLVRAAHATQQPMRAELSLPARNTLIELSALPLATGPLARVIVSVAERSTGAPQLDALRRMDRLASLGTLSASMAHEVRNAFVAVKTFIDLLLEQNPKTELADLVHREMRRIDSLVAQMLRFAAPVTSGRKQVSLHTTLEHTLRMLGPNLKARAIRLEKNFAAQPDWIAGDDYQLEQAFLNLLVNAIEAMGAEGELTLSTEKTAAEDPRAAGTRFAGQAGLLVRVADTGPGISAEARQHLFEPFFTTKPNGTGLGLAITRRIVRENGGEIRLDSEPGQGCVFSLWFPPMPAA